MYHLILFDSAVREDFEKVLLDKLPDVLFACKNQNIHIVHIINKFLFNSNSEIKSIKCLELKNRHCLDELLDEL